MPVRQMPLDVTDDDPRYTFCRGIRARSVVLIFSILRWLGLLRFLPFLVPYRIPGVRLVFFAECMMAVFMQGILLDNLRCAKTWLVYAPFLYIISTIFHLGIISELPESKRILEQIENSDCAIAFGMAGWFFVVLYIFCEYRACWLHYKFLRDSIINDIINHHHNMTFLPDGTYIQTYEDRIGKKDPLSPVEDHRSQAFQV